MAIEALIRRSLSRVLKPLIAVGLVLAALQTVLVLQANAQQEAQTFGRIAEMMPAFIRRALGEMTLVVVSFQGAVSAAFFHPVVVLVIAFIGVYFGSEPAYDVESGIVDLVLSRPLPRQWVITRALALVLIGTCAAPAILALTMAVALRLFTPGALAQAPTATTVLKMALNLTALATLAGTISLAVASRARRRGTAISVACVTGVLCYLVTFLEPTWAPAQAIGPLSPFHYYHPVNILAGRSEPWRDLIVLGGASAAFAALAYWQFNRRDL
jgi:ABC-type transport system involved in multi-copper enzyme maturation permease subunit